MFKRRWFSVVIASSLAILLLAGLFMVMPVYAQGGGIRGNSGNNSGFGPGWMMQNTQGISGTNQYGPGWMMGQPYNNNGNGFFGGPGWMMRNTQGFSGTNQFGPGWMMNQFFGNDAENFFGPGGMMGGGMMLSPNNVFYAAPQPLTMEEATIILDAYLADLNDNNLIYRDVMIFDNHTYAQIVEQDSGTGVMEVLIDPTTRVVYPEMGPNMMWNQDYGMTLAPARSAGVSDYGRYGMMGMMRGLNGFGQGFGSGNGSAEMTVSPAEAVAAAQSYLDTNFSAKGLTADNQADPFYGYYTLHVIRDGQPVGMLSVNGFTGTVWPHTWHGRLLEMGGE